MAPLSDSELKLWLRTVLDEWQHERESDTTSSIATPEDYEETSRQHLLVTLEDTFGLRVLPNDTVHREEGDGDLGEEWDFVRL